MSHDDETVNDLFDLTDGTCFYCEKSISVKNYGRVGERGAFEVDHFIPVSRGGDDEFENWVPACVDCNTRKADLMPWEFMPDDFVKDDWDSRNYL